jgi:nucleoside-diphosphate-sugar epimerase
MPFPRTIAITGGSGSLGRVITPLLLERPEVERVSILDPAKPAREHQKLVHRPIDVRDPALAEQLSGTEALLHLAFVVERGSRDTSSVDAINVEGSKNVFLAAQKAGVAHVVYASSIAAYGFHPENAGARLTEGAPLRGNAEFYYARTKAEVERWLDAFEASPGAPVVARLRPCMFLGPQSRPERLSLLNAKVVPHLGASAPPIHLCHEDDVALAFLLALEHRAKGAFNVADDEPLPVSDWAAVLGRRAIRIPRFVLSLAGAAYALGIGDMDPVWIRLPSKLPLLVCADRIKRELGWKPKYPSTKEALAELARFSRS